MGFARRLIDLMLLRRGPQDIPGNQTTLAVSAAAYCILLFVQVAQITPLGPAAAQALLATVLLGLYASTILRLRKVSARFPQTATALFSVGAVLTLIMLAPMRAMAPYLQAISQSADPQNVAMPPGIVLLVYFVLGIWGLAIFSHIYRHALNATFALGLGAAVGFEVLQLVVFSLLD